jgi:hypothetical protein
MGHYDHEEDEEAMQLAISILLGLVILGCLCRYLYW